MGYAPAIVFNFNSGFQVDTFLQVFGIKNSSCISDTNGSLLLFSTGFFLGNFDGDLVQLGDKINCPYGTVLSDYYGGGSLFAQTSIILPRKGNQYYVFSTGMSDSVANNYLNHVWTEFDVLNYSIVDMDSNAGKGKVVAKNVVLADKQHYAGTALQAVKHANGKDWWLVKADCKNNRYQEFLVREDTILGPFYQYPSVTGGFCFSFGEIHFSPDGSTMASSTYGEGTNAATYNFNRADFYDFDRCDGKITYRNHYIVPWDTTTYPNDDVKMGICFSPNGKLLYMTNTYTVYQIDLEDTNKYNSLFIHGPDTALAQFPWYELMGLGPDGRIYVGNYGGQRKYMSLIDSPNVRGLGCAFRPQGLSQPYNNNLQSPPNMPNYGLGPDTSKPCWPLGLSEIEESAAAEEWVLYPNPAQTQLTIESEAFKKGLNSLRIFNLMGQCVLEGAFRTVSGKHTVSVQGLPAGVYFMKVNNMVRRVVVE